ncbi:hypothetical protein HXW73_12215 [Halomonas sp. SH5A2]|uniref:hypothetical protein n=1 Tax=Halomonas sp. SH5A2 TaxID=2749040 RepID=UPI00163E2586|nr:hypothetical protein [Halomonas sp. SH5A2]QNI03629.1 hypothetical protein HXW73_12215 [Halomonas sp. SH5A2]
MSAIGRVHALTQYICWRLINRYWNRFIGPRRFQLGELAMQHIIALEVMIFSSRQTLPDRREITFQVDKQDIRLSLAYAFPVTPMTTTL